MRPIRSAWPAAGGGVSWGPWCGRAWRLRRGRPQVRSRAGRSRSWPPRTSGGASPRSSAATRSQVTSIITNPDTDPHDYEPTARRRAHHRDRGAGDRQRHRLRPLGDAAGRRQPGRGRDVLDVGELVGVRPAVTRTAGTPRPTCTRSSTQITADYQRLDPADSAYFDAAAARVRDHGDLADVRRPHRRHQGQVRRHAGRRLGEHLRAARAGARAWSCSRRRASSSHQRGHRPHGGDKADHRRPDRSTSRSRSTCTTRRTRPPTCRPRSQAAKAAGIPVRRSPRPSTPPAPPSRRGRSRELEALQAALARATGRLTRDDLRADDVLDA